MGEHPELDLLSVEHNDLHAAMRSWWTGACDQRLGRCGARHPFASLRALLFPARTCSGRRGDGDPGAYLEEFFAGGEAPPQQVQQRALDLAMTLGAANRLQCWTVMPERVAEYAEYIVRCGVRPAPFAEVSMA
ncbi:hypothetical protein [Micrococcus sp. FDAARGOS_333]|uniref:hypothetical protein n=1 Tax=Micrococcus sp. FDAARGOS_333 TaxID=1930558 RepID=UPI000FDAB243|nr:hypothetical protein [Micrococcus sp. FDAARGOS_333]